eukprot:11533241-Alexandrium_andersonii.AAC.1
MDEAAVPAGPAGRNVLVHGLESAENGDPFSCSSRRRGLRAKRGALGAQRRYFRVGPRFSADSKPRTRAFRPAGPAGIAASSVWN